MVYIFHFHLVHLFLCCFLGIQKQLFKSCITACSINSVILFPFKSYSYVLHSMFSLHAFTFPLGVLVALYVNANKKQTLLISAVSAFAFVCVFYGIAQHYAVHAVMVASMLFSVALPSFLSYFNIRNRVFAFLGAYPMRFTF